MRRRASHRASRVTRALRRSASGAYAAAAVAAAAADGGARSVPKSACWFTRSAKRRIGDEQCAYRASPSETWPVSRAVASAAGAYSAAVMGSA